jgi:flagellar biosynthesis protein FlhB
MTDLLSIMFILGIVVIFSIVAFVIKNTILAIVSGMGWSLSSIYMFAMSASGDPDMGTFTNAFGYLCLIMAMACFIAVWYLHRKKTILMDNKTGETFYTEGDPEFKDINDMYAARKARRKLRGR